MITPIQSNILVLGASEQPHRYSNQAARRLMEAGYPVWLLGNRPGMIEGRPVTTEWPGKEVMIHTITVYLSPDRLESQLDAICSLRPQRVILNPGTEHSGHTQRLLVAGICVEEACTLVLLNTGQF
ncbi:MAG: CoA-binding protein [Sphingomonadales bacterium]|nr:CoA-binding protein [Sphingomonadales bacterium]